MFRSTGKTGFSLQSMSKSDAEGSLRASSQLESFQIWQTEAMIGLQAGYLTKEAETHNTHKTFKRWFLFPFE